VPDVMCPGAAEAGSLTCEAASALSAPIGAAAIASAAAASDLPPRHGVSVQSASRRLGFLHMLVLFSVRHVSACC
jgi:hypothetical protein